MEDKEAEEEEIILKEFAKLSVDISTLKNKSNNVYAQLAKRLNTSRRKIFKVIAKWQPRAVANRHRLVLSPINLNSKN